MRRTRPDSAPRVRSFAVGQTPAQQAAMVLDLTGTATETERAQDALCRP